jgi:hypothetical protein
MAAPYNPPVKNEDGVHYICLMDFNIPGRIKSSPTIAAGDFTISKDGGAFANLATLPDIEPNSSRGVRIQLSSTEMNADNVLIVWADQTEPPEWSDGWLSIPTTQ